MSAPHLPPLAPAGHLVHDAREHGLVGDGVTNDQPALAALVDALGAACADDGLPRVIYCPPGVYSIRDVGTVWRSGVSLVGAGPAATRFVLANPGDRSSPTPLAYFTALQHGAGVDNHIADCTFAGFEIDGSGVDLDEYDVLAKGLGLQYVLRGRFRDLYIHATAATGFGCDFLQDTVVESVLTVGCGRLDNGDQMGGAGIGIGIGGWGDERLSVTECTATGNGTNGIFVELQREAWPPPRGISITGCHVTDNRFGISDWGAQGLVVSACTITGNHQVGFDVSSRGTATVGGRGGLVTGCLIDLNVGDGVAIGGTPGPYTVQGNRISGNGGYGYRVHDIGCAEPVTAQEVVIEGNGIRDNALDGVRLDGATCDAFVVGNRIRNNGRRAAPAACGGGPNVRYTALSMIDQGAAWLPDGHRGKILTAGDETAVVTANSGTGLMLAPVRPGASSAWAGDPPAGGTPYRLPDPPSTRAGITVNATAVSPTLRANRSWDTQQTRSQTHGLWITADGRCTDGRVVDNDLEGNAVGAARFDTAPSGGLWERNHGLPARRGDGPAPAPIGQRATVPSGPGSSGC